MTFSNLSMASLAFLTWILGSGFALAQASAEFDANSGGTATTPPTEGPITFTFRNNTNNPGGNTFANINAPRPQVIARISDQGTATSANFATQGLMVGGTFAGDPHLVRMNFFGGAQNGHFTSLPTVAAGTGIAVNTNHTILMEYLTNGLLLSGAAPTGRHYVGQIQIDFNVNVSAANLVLHLSALGGNAGGKTFAAEFELNTADSIGATGFQLLSSNGAMSVTPTAIWHSDTGTLGTACNVAAPRGACGSISILGEGIYRLAMDVYVRSDDAVAWPNNGSEGFMMGFSGEFSDMRSNFTPATIPATLNTGRRYQGLTATCNNQGPHISRFPDCQIVASAGEIFNQVCTPDIRNTDLLANGATVTCTFDYRAPPLGSGIPSVTFRSGSGAGNDRNGGVDPVAGNNASAATAPITVDYTTTALLNPTDICTTIAQRATFTFPNDGPSERDNYDLVSASPIFYDVLGNPHTGVALTQTTIPTDVKVLFRPGELRTDPIASRNGEMLILSSRIEGRPGSIMPVNYRSVGDQDHSVFIVEDGAGNVVNRFPVSGSTPNNQNEYVNVTIPPSGFLIARQFIVDYAGNYSDRFDPGCMKSDIVTEKSVSDPNPSENELVTYTIRMTNFGPSDQTNTSLTDVLPAGLTYQSFTATGGSYDPVTGIWTVPTIVAGQAAELNIVARVNNGTGGTTITNTITSVLSDNLDELPADDDFTAAFVVSLPANVTAQKTRSIISENGLGCEDFALVGVTNLAALPGSCIEYRISVQNTGQDDAVDLIIPDVLSEDLIFLGATRSGFIETDPEFLYLAPAPMQDCFEVPCAIRVENATLPAGGSAEIVIRTFLK